MMKWEPSELAESLTESEHRKRELLRKIVMEDAHQEMLLTMLRQALNDMERIRNLPRVAPME